MRIVDIYEINDGQIFSIELEEDRFVDVKVCDGKLDGLIYVVQNEDGSTVYSDKAYSDKGVDAVYPGFEYDEKAVLDLVKEAMNKGMGKIKVAIESTDDYSDAQFHSKLVDSDIRNDDGTYGKVVESYRIVNINENGKIDKFDDRVFESHGAAKEAILSDSAFELVSYDDLVHEAGALLRCETPSDEKLVNIFDLEYDDEGYLHFRVMADDYALEGLYRLYDPANGPDMTLVSIDYGYMHPIIERQWSRIEEALYDTSLSRYHDILDKSEAFKEKVINAMEAAGYTYDVLESHEGWETFYGEGGIRLGFDRLREAAEWLEGVVFDDPEIGRKVEEIMHPERQEASGSVEAMIGDAKERCIDAGAAENKTQEYMKD